MLFVLDHPVVAEQLGRLRDRSTPTAQFRAAVEDLSLFLAYEASRDLPRRSISIETPLTVTTAEQLAVVPILAPILRAGLALTSGFQRVFPDASTAHIGMYRHPETLEPVPYYANLPDEPGTRPVFILDPMLATGNSAAAAVTTLQRTGAQDIRLVSLIAAPEGIAALTRRFPHLKIYTAAVDSHLNEHGYIVPGLGDAGDRIFGTTHSTPSVLT